jgi:transcriptional regulator with XRE-family HTH domain
MYDLSENLRLKIRAGRNLMNLSQAELAALLGITDVKLSRIESGQTKSAKVLLEVQAGMERLGVVFTKNGVEFSEGHIEILSGSNCYIDLLEEVSRVLGASDMKELLIMFASDSVSPPEVNEKYRAMRKAGVSMRQLISEDDTYIMGPFNEYRCIPERYFSNIVRLIYGNCVAQVSGDASKVTIHYDAPFAESSRLDFNYYWDTGTKPQQTTASEKFEQ